VVDHNALSSLVIDATHRTIWFCFKTILNFSWFIWHIVLCIFIVYNIWFLHFMIFNFLMKSWSCFKMILGKSFWNICKLIFCGFIIECVLIPLELFGTSFLAQTLILFSFAITWICLVSYQSHISYWWQFGIL